MRRKAHHYFVFWHQPVARRLRRSRSWSGHWLQQTGLTSDLLRSLSTTRDDAVPRGVPHYSRLPWQDGLDASIWGWKLHPSTAIPKPASCARRSCRYIAMRLA